MYIRVDATPGAKKEFITKIDSISFAVSVREKAERNMANRRIVELVRKEFGGKGVIVKIVSGHRSPRKVLDVEILEK